MTDDWVWEIEMSKMAIRYGALCGMCLLTAISASAAATPADNDYPTVQDRLTRMDRDHDGMVTVEEVRAYMEAIHGKGYEQPLMDEMVSAANSKSCGSPFSRSFY